MVHKTLRHKTLLGRPKQTYLIMVGIVPMERTVHKLPGAPKKSDFETRIGGHSKQKASEIIPTRRVSPHHPAGPSLTRFEVALFLGREAMIAN
jgi:hypothetical protein